MTLKKLWSSATSKRETSRQLDKFPRFVRSIKCKTIQKRELSLMIGCWLGTSSMAVKTPSNNTKLAQL